MLCVPRMFWLIYLCVFTKEYSSLMRTFAGSEPFRQRGAHGAALQRSRPAGVGSAAC